MDATTAALTQDADDTLKAPLMESSEDHQIHDVTQDQQTHDATPPVSPVPFVDSEQAVGSEQDQHTNVVPETSKQRPLKMNHMEMNMRLNTVWPPESQVPSSWSVINGALLFRKLPAEDKLKQMAMDLSKQFARLRAVAQEDGEWEPIEPDSLDLSYHVHFEPEVAGVSELTESLDRVGQEDLDMTKPPWRFHCIPCSDSQGYAAVVVRVHHCIGDGVHLSKLLMHLTVKADGTHVDVNASQQKFEAMMNDGGGAVCRSVRKLGKAIASPAAFVSNGIASMKPLEANSVWQKSADDRRRGKFGGKRCVVFIPPHSLDFVKQCKNKAGVSVNDILMGATSGAIRRYCESQQDPLFNPGSRSNAKFRALVPVSMPKAFPVGHDETDKLTNHWCFCSAKIPVREATPLDRVRSTNHEMGKLKRSMKPFVGLWMINKMSPRLPTATQQKTAKDLFANHSLVFSNIPGPQEPLYVGGERLEGCQLVYYNVIPQIILVSISGQVWMNITVDPDVVTDRDGFVKCYFEELEELGKELGVTAGMFNKSDATVDISPLEQPSPQEVVGSDEVAQSQN
jgi:hypothetical protein